jgi:hypothetical protein
MEWKLKWKEIKSRIAIEKAAFKKKRVFLQAK